MEYLCREGGKIVFYPSEGANGRLSLVLRVIFIRVFIYVNRRRLGNIFPSSQRFTETPEVSLLTILYLVW